MKVTCISHACLLIDTGSFLIATDPWFDGPAFCDQWHVFPKPIDTEPVATAPVILISHPHEDHLHEPTLRRVCREPKTLFYPFYWYPETRNKIRSRAADDNLMTSAHWLTGDVEAIRRAYRLPDLNETDSAA